MDNLPKGILHTRVAKQKFILKRFSAAPELDFFIQRYWTVRWDLRGQEPHLQEKIAYPCVNLVIERNNTKVYGVTLGKSAHLLQGEGFVFGVKFRPGGFYPFVKSPVSEFTNRSLSFDQAFGIEPQALEKQILSASSEEEMVQIADQFFRDRLPQRDETLALIHDIIAEIVSNREITKVEKLVANMKINQRMLQRIFKQYVGLSPKWVIKLYRLHEAAGRIAAKDYADLTQLALELGYYDQAHFSKDFRTIIGQSPYTYASQSG